jgi:hypothetical protein
VVQKNLGVKLCGFSKLTVFSGVMGGKKQNKNLCVFCGKKSREGSRQGLDYIINLYKLGTKKL